MRRWETSAIQDRLLRWKWNGTMNWMGRKAGRMGGRGGTGAVVGEEDPLEGIERVYRCVL